MVLGNLKLIVFDLDYTLWPFWVDTHVDPPFTKRSDGVILDSSNRKVDCYYQVPEVLSKLCEEGYTLATASRTSEIKGARQLIELFGWDKYFKYHEIFPGTKVNHFNNLKQKTSFDFNEMIFFDDEERNIRDVTKLGVVSYLVRKGVTKKVIDEGLLKYSTKSK